MGDRRGFRRRRFAGIGGRTFDRRGAVD